MVVHFLPMRVSVLSGASDDLQLWMCDNHQSYAIRSIGRKINHVSLPYIGIYNMYICWSRKNQMMAVWKKWFYSSFGMPIGNWNELSQVIRSKKRSFFHLFILLIVSLSASFALPEVERKIAHKFSENWIVRHTWIHRISEWISWMSENEIW